MQMLRNSTQLARFVLVWFALSVGVVIASHIIKPESTVLICTGAGVTKLVALDEDSDKPVNSHTLDCPLCVSYSPPPPIIYASTEPLSGLNFALQSIATAYIACVTAPPLPSRGPPALFL
jgi:hypothetical protein